MKKLSYPVSFRRADYSLLQSAVAHVARKRARQLNAQIDCLASEEPMMQELVAGLQALEQGTPAQAGFPLEECVQWAIKYVQAVTRGDKEEADKILADMRFTPCDAKGWLETLKVWNDYYVRAKRQPEYKPCKNLADYVYPLPETGKDGKNLVIGVLGDWGTGMPSAKTVLQELMKSKPDLILHLGDIYYAGTDEECKQNFLEVIRPYTAGIPIYSIPGNHEYFSGGAGYYSAIAELNRSTKAKWARVQEASFFCLKNEWVQIQAMDTGWGSHKFPKEGAAPELEHSEARWQQHQIQQGLEEKPNRRIILLSHHQPWSAFEVVDGDDKSPVNKHLLEIFAEPLKNGKITAWLWGHWHVLEAYKSPIQLPDPVNKECRVLGRCLGHAAFPVLKSTKPYNVNSREFKKYVDDKIGMTGLSAEGKVFNHGYAVLTLSPASGEAAYYEVDASTGKPLRDVKKETLYRNAGRAARA